MSVMLICTLGNRDLLLYNEQIKPPRQKGKEILENFDKYHSSLTFPIIKPVFDYIFQDEEQEKIDRFVLVATDQDPHTTKPEHRENDTIEYAKILRRLVEKHYGGKKVAQIHIVKIPQNPNFLDDMYDFFGKSLEHNKTFKMEDLEICYVEQTGGIPSANMALLFQCINRFKEKCRPVYVSEKTRVATPLKFVEQILGEYRKSLFLHLANNYDYASLCEHLDEKKETERFIHRLSEYAQHRLYFDTGTARSIARKAAGEFLSHQRNIFEGLNIDLERIEKRDYISLIIELFHNLKIKYSREEYVDFAGRIFRFQEAVLRYLVESELGLSTEIDKRTGTQTAFFQGIESRPDLKEFIASEKTPYGEPINYKRFGIPILMACLKYLITREEKTSYQPVYEILQKLNSIVELRNRSILGHGFEGISKQILENTYDGPILEDLKTLLETCGIRIIENPFDKVNKILQREIQRLDQS